jgi:hypothetical protein
MAENKTQATSADVTAFIAGVADGTQRADIHRIAEMMARLGKHKTGKSCLYVKRLSDVDTAVLEEMVIGTLAYMAEKYPD